MNKILHTKRIFLILFLLNLVAILVFGGVFWHLKNKNQVLSEYENEQELILQKSLAFRSSKDVLKETEEKRERLSNFFVSSEEVADFIEKLESVGRQSGVDVNINDVKVLEIDGDSFKEDLEVNLEASGNWDSVFHYLSLIESLPYVVEIEQARLSEREAEGSNFWVLNIVLTTFKLK